MNHFFLQVLLMLFLPFMNHGDGVKNRLLLCLAKEEEFIHKRKIRSPLYPLNQFFINEFSSYQGLKLKEPYYREVCQGEKFQTSLTLMRLLLTEGTGIFERDSSFRAIQVSILENIRNSMFQVFFQHIARLEALAPNAHCLKNGVPHLKEITERYRHLGVHGPSQVGQTDLSKIREIFSSLENISTIYRKCRAER